MVWRQTEPSEQQRRAWWRAAVVWGLFLLLAAAAFAVQQTAPARAQLRLGEPVRVGPLSARLPQGWLVGVDEARLQLQALEPGGRILAVALVPSEGLSVQHFLLDMEGRLIDGPRAVTVAGQRGVMVILVQRLQTPLGPQEAVVTMAAAEVSPGQLVVLSLVRPGGWSSADPVLVQQVAEAVRFAPEAS